MAPTLVRPPPQDTSRAPIENALELTDLSVIGPDIYTNTRQLWHPPGARGIYGGAVIAQTLAAAQRTVPPNFVVHSYHCFFVLAGDSEIPILYHVERVREGRSFATRTVQARQKGHAIFTVTCSFVREDSSGAATSSHQIPMPAELVNRPPGESSRDIDSRQDSTAPFETHSLPLTVEGGGIGDKAWDQPDKKRSRRWVRARGQIQGGHQEHLSALAYVTDSYFIGTVAQVHRLWRVSAAIKKAIDEDPGDGSWRTKIPADDLKTYESLNDFEGDGKVDLGQSRGQPRIGMMVSLDHTIYFHNPKKVRADEWMLTETDSPWAGDGRGLVTQRMWSQDGTLLATCIQEGVVRLNATDGKEDKKKAKL